MGVLKNDRSEQVAQALYNRKEGENLKDLCKNIEGITYSYFSSLSRKREVLERVEELKALDKNRDILNKEDRLKLLTTIINEEQDTDTKIKAIQALDKIDDKTIKTEEGHKQIIIQLPDNGRN